MLIDLINNLENYLEALLKKQNPPPKEINTGNQAAIIGGSKPFTPKELQTNDIT